MPTEVEVDRIRLSRGEEGRREYRPLLINTFPSDVTPFLISLFQRFGASIDICAVRSRTRAAAAADLKGKTTGLLEDFLSLAHHQDCTRGALLPLIGDLYGAARTLAMTIASCHTTPLDGRIVDANSPFART
jgi:hypothetical protein